MSILKLKGKMVENGYNTDSLAAAMGVDRSTLYRKMNRIKSFSVGDAQKIKDVLCLTVDEFMAIFFT